MILSFVLMLSASAGETAGDLGAFRTRVDARRLQTGEFIYRDSAKGKVLGEGTISIRLGEHDLYHFSAEIKGYADQQWESVVTPTFTPISARLSFGKGPDRATAFRLDYSTEKVTGFARARQSSEPGSQRPVNASIDSNTVDQRLDWAAVMAFDLRPGVSFGFNVFDPATGRSDVHVQVSPRRRIEVPAGTFDVLAITYSVKKSTGAEQYLVYATESLPRFMVREDFPDGTISELIKRP